MSWFETGKKDVANDTKEVADPYGNKRELNNEQWGGHSTTDSQTGEVFDRQEDGSYKLSLFQPA